MKISIFQLVERGAEPSGMFRPLTVNLPGFALR